MVAILDRMRFRLERFRPHLLVALIFPLLIAAPTVGFAQMGGLLEVSQETSGCCGIHLPDAGLISLYVLHIDVFGGVQGVRFSAPKPDCLGATYLSDTQVLPVTSGNSQTDVQIVYGFCLGPLQEPLHILTINFIVDSATPACCFYSPRVAAGQTGLIETLDCDGNSVQNAAATPNVINSNPACACHIGTECPWVPAPVERNTWGAIKSLYEGR